MIRGVLGFVMGFVSGFVAISLIQLANSHFFPMPQALQNFDFNNPKQIELMREFVAGLPLTALIVVIVSHGFGAFLAAFVASYFARPNQMIPAMLLGVLFLAAGVMNLMMIPHPKWFAFADLAVYVPCAFLAANCFSRNARGDVNHEEQMDSASPSAESPAV